MSAHTEAALRRLGQSLREIDPATLNEDPVEGPVRWFQGEGGTELTAWIDERGAPYQVQLIFPQAHVEWTGGTLATGRFEVKSSTAGGRYDPYLLQVASGVDAAMCRAALTVLDASDLAAEIKEPLRSALERALG